MRKVLAFGSFDILHKGHILYLTEARKLGSSLTVIVARDASIRMFKGRDPFFDEKTRLYMIGSLKVVDKAVLGGKLSKPSDVYNIFLKYRPDVVAIGYDQRVDVDELRSWLRAHSIDAKVVRIKKRLDEDFYKSSLIKKRIASL